MKMKRILLMVFVSGVGILGITTTQAASGSSENANLSAEVGQATQQVVEKAKAYSGWDWLRRTDLTFETMDLRKPTWGIETIQPLYQTPDSLSNTYFFQGRWGYRNLDNTFNLGLGYRHLFDNQKLLLGINGFYDIATRYKHQRIGAGAEAIGRYLTLRANYYEPISNRKTISETGGITTYGKALRGYDGEIDVPVPFMPWIRFAANIFRWKHDAAGLDDITGNTLVIRSNLTKYLFLELGRKNDTQLFSQKYIMVTLNLLGLPNNGAQGTMADGIFNRTPFSARDLTEHTLDKVQRQNDIIVETTSSGGSGVTIGRGT